LSRWLRGFRVVEPPPWRNCGFGVGMTPIQYLLGGGCGVLTGLILGAIGGGGSILATPLIIYVAGVSDPHLAIGTSALCVAACAGSNLANHARSGRVRWIQAGLFAVTGVIGALIGSAVGKVVDGRRLLALFALMMIAVAVLMLKRRENAGPARGAPISWAQRGKLSTAGVCAGGLAGFFGIGGGFLIVPSLIWATGMPMLDAVSSSLLAVTVFGLATAFNYALAGWVLWPMAAAFFAGGIVGGMAGAKLAVRLAASRNMLGLTFSGLLVLVAVYMLYRSL
jgi:uncharacterized protein